MALPDVAQAQLLANEFESLLNTYRPASLAVIGCAGGNGFERIDASVTTRVVGVDINAHYVDALRERHAARGFNLELIVGDIQGGEVRFAPVDFVYAALVLEYVDVGRTLECLRPLLAGNGILATVVQLPGADAVTPTHFESLVALAPVMHLVDPDRLARVAHEAGFRERERRSVEAQGGKHFTTQVFSPVA